MVFGLDIVNNLVSEATGGDKGAKTRAKTHMNTDMILTKAATTIPLVLLIFIRFFTPSIFKEDSLKCSRGHTIPNSKLEAYVQSQQDTTPWIKKDDGQYAGQDYMDISMKDYNEMVVQSGNNNRFWMYRYCWDSMLHHPLNSTGQPVYEDVTYIDENGNSITENRMKEPINLRFHVLYPYYMFTALALLYLPMIFWTNYAQANVQASTEYLVEGISEALHMAVETLSACLSDGSIFKEDPNARKAAMEKWERQKELDAQKRQQENELKRVKENEIIQGQNSDKPTVAIVMDEKPMMVTDKDIKDSHEIFQLFEEKYENKQELLHAKFAAIAKFMNSELNKTDIPFMFLFYRLGNIVLLFVVSWFLYDFTLWNRQNMFNCKMPTSAKHYDIETNTVDSSYDYVVCNISGVKFFVFLEFEIEMLLKSHRVSSQNMKPSPYFPSLDHLCLDFLQRIAIFRRHFRNNHRV